MNENIRTHLDNLYSKDAELRYYSFQYLLNETNEPVGWIGLAWDDLLALLHGDNHQRAIAAQLMCNLAKSDPERAMESIERVMEVTKDERFVTARHSLQSLWKVAIASEALEKEIVTRLVNRFNDCNIEKNCTLIRYDILEVFRKIFDTTKDEKLKNKSLNLIETETDPKYKKKYMALWRDVLKQELNT